MNQDGKASFSPHSRHLIPLLPLQIYVDNLENLAHLQAVCLTEDIVAFDTEFVYFPRPLPQVRSTYHQSRHI